MVDLDRFWCRPDGNYRSDDDGYLLDPTARFLSTSMNPQAVGTTTLVDARCLVLVGEPGIGKSNVLQAHSPLLPPFDTPPAVLVLDLSVCDTSDLTSVLGQDTITDWIAGTHELVVVIDGFDEAHDRMPTLPRRLAVAVASWPVDRLWLRIACRTADWPDLLDAEVTALFNDPACFELLPLRAIDVAKFAELGDKTADFLRAVRHTRAVPLAARPLTLKMLVEAYKKSGSLPVGSAALYRVGITSLCEEVNRDRVAAGFVGRLAPSERLAIAGRVAAYSLLSDRPTVHSGAVSGADPTDLTINDIVGGTETTGGTYVDITAEAVKEALRTGLFSGRAGGRLGWGHATFRDYLGALWMDEHLTDEQLRSLLLGNDGRIYPQVQGAASWLVAIGPGRYRWLVDADAQAFASDVAYADESTRAAIVGGIHADAKAGTLIRHWGASYRSLGYEGLANQVRPWLTDASREVRDLGFDLARDAELRELRGDLIDVVVDQAVDARERAQAGWALYALGRTEPVYELRPVALGDVGSDPQDDVRGTALLVSWPHAVTTAEVLAHLPVPQRSNFHGAYASFLGDLSGRIEAAHLPAALGWLRENPNPMDHRVAGVANSIIRLALQHLDDPNCRAMLIDLVMIRCQTYEGLLHRDFGDESDPLDDPDLRRGLGAAVLEAGPVGADFAYSATEQSAHGLGLFREADLQWIADRYRDRPNEREGLGQVAGAVFHSSSIAGRDVLLELDKTHPLHRDHVAGWIAPVSLDSERAIAGRAQQAEIRRRRQEREQAPPPDTVNADIAGHLDRFEAGEIFGYWLAIRLLGAPPSDPRRLREQHFTRITATRRWEELDAAERRRFIDGASRYLSGGKCEPDQWLNIPQLWYPAEAGYRALRLLADEAPDQLADLPAEVWREWAPIIIAGSVYDESEQRDQKVELIREAAPHATDVMVAAVIARFKHAVTVDEYVSLLGEVDEIWSDELAAALVRLVDDDESKPIPVRQMVDWLVEHDIDRVRPTLQRWLADRSTDGLRTRAARAGALMLHGDPASASTVMDALSDPTLGPAIVAAAAGFHRPVPPYTADELADLFLWLVRAYPYTEDPDELHHTGAVTTRMQIAHWRDAVLAHIRDLGTAEGVAAMHRMATAVPSVRWLKRAEAEAQAVARRSTWTPLDPRTIAALAGDGSKRLVRTAEELLRLTVAVLGDLQQRLHGDTPEAQFLWDTTAKVPKSEDAMSDFVLGRLRERLVASGAIINREVQVRRFQDAGIGERSDIQIEAVTAGPPPEALAVMVEAKLAWNREWRSAMRDQLVEKYLNPVNSGHGVFLVFWSDSVEQWDAEHRHRNRIAGLDRESMVADLERQAEALAEEGYRIEVVVLDVTWPSRRSAGS